MSKEVLRIENTASTSGGAAISNIDHQNNRMNPTTVETTINHPDTVPVQQVFSFWAPLMQYNDAVQSSLLLHYPTFSTVGGAHVRDGHFNNENLTIRRATAWQSLDTRNQHFVNHPPIVELVNYD
jgi:hypothetical protein